MNSEPPRNTAGTGNRNPFHTQEKPAKCLISTDYNRRAESAELPAPHHRKYRRNPQNLSNEWITAGRALSQTRKTFGMYEVRDGSVDRGEG
jgi:hypothetical protein